MIREALAKLVENRTLSGEEAYLAMADIMGGAATPAQIAAFLVALRLRGETPDIVAGCARAMREKVTPVDRPDGIVVDTCGTGGDGLHTFNISTCVAFVVAGAGVRVAKHGNRNVSSKCGSADVLEALGVNLSIPPAAMARCLDRVGVAFLFAQALHPAMKHAAGPRKEMGIRTVFNLLGPLSNPAGAQHGVIGVYSLAAVELVAGAAAQLGAEHLFVVHGHDGLDEISITGLSTLAEVRGGAVRTFEVGPEDFGVNAAPMEALRGGDAGENASIVHAILAGEKGPRRDIVLENAAAVLVAGGAAANFLDGMRVAAESIETGRAEARLRALVAETREFI